MTAPMLELSEVRKYFPVGTGSFLRRKTGWVKAVEGISFAIATAETLGLIGESGCGKTTTSKLILLQERPTAGTIRFDGEDVADTQRYTVLIHFFVDHGEAIARLDVEHEVDVVLKDLGELEGDPFVEIGIGHGLEQ